MKRAIYIERVANGWIVRTDDLRYNPGVCQDNDSIYVFNKLCDLQLGLPKLLNAIPPPEFVVTIGGASKTFHADLERLNDEFTNKARKESGS